MRDMQDSLLLEEMLKKEVPQSLAALGNLKAPMGQNWDQNIMPSGKMGERLDNLECSLHYEEPLTHIR